MNSFFCTVDSHCNVLHGILKLHTGTLQKLPLLLAKLVLKTKNSSSSLVLGRLQIFPWSSKHSFNGIGHEIIFIAILSLLLVKVWHLLVNVALKECSLGTD